MAGDQQVHRIRNFLGGRNTTFSEGLLEAGDSPGDLNVRYRPIGALTKRQGWRHFLDPSFGSGSVRGLHRLYKLDATKHLFVYAAPTLWGVDQDLTRTALKNDFAPETFMDFASMRDRAYGTNFEDRPIRSDATAAGTETAELARPIVPGLTLYLAGSTLPATTDSKLYGYKFRAFYGEELGESGYGGEMEEYLYTKQGTVHRSAHYHQWVAYSQTQTVTELFPVTLDLTLITPPPGAESIRIYRTQAVIPISDYTIDLPFTEVWNSNFYFVDEVRVEDLSASYTDGTRDENLGALSDIGALDPLFTPYARYVAAHAGRIFYAHATPIWLEAFTKQDFLDNGFDEYYWTAYRQETFWVNVGPDQTSRVYWSQDNVPDNIEGFQDVYPQDGDAITGMAVVGDNLIIFKRRHIYRMSGFDPQDLRINVISANVGCMAPRSIAVLPHREAVIWLAEDGVYTYDGAGIQRVSDKIRADLLAIPKANRAMAAGVVHQNLYYLSVAET